MKEIAELNERIDNLTELVSTLVDKFENMQIEKPKKEKKPRKPVDMSNKAASLVGKRVNGWVVQRDGIMIVATKKGEDEIRVSGMKNRDDFIDMLN